MIESFAAVGASVLGISKDSVKSHGSFRDKHGLKIPLLSDPDLSIHKAYGAWGEKTMYGKKVEGTIRSTFVVDGEGRVVAAFPSVKVDGHADAVLAAIGGKIGARPASAAKARAKKVAQ
jgi:peroxiredoxin Q/BCP